MPGTSKRYPGGLERGARRRHPATRHSPVLGKGRPPAFRGIPIAWREGGSRAAISPVAPDGEVEDARGATTDMEVSIMEAMV